MNFPTSWNAPTDPLRGLRILILEDDEDLRASLAEHCLAAGAEVRDAGDLRTARRLIDAEPFDLLLTDLQLPDGRGHDFANEARERTAQLRVVALTGQSSEDEIDASHAAGFDAHVRKPFEASVLVELLAAVARPRS
jgi:DNA-binding response OmpR family regulator